MDKFFKKAGKITATGKKEVKVTYTGDSDDKSELQILKVERRRKKDQEEENIRLQELKKRRIYEFTKEQKTDEEKLEDLLRSESAKKTDSENYKLGDQVTLAEQEENQTLQGIYTKGYKMLQASGGFKSLRMGMKEDGILKPIIPVFKKSLGTNEFDPRNLKFQDAPKSKQKKVEEKLTVNEKTILSSIQSWKRGNRGRKQNRESQIEKSLEQRMKKLELDNDESTPSAYKIIDMRNANPEVHTSFDTLDLKSHSGDGTKLRIRGKETSKYSSYHPVHLMKKLREDKRLKLQNLDNIMYSKNRAKENVNKYKEQLVIAAERHTAIKTKKEKLIFTIKKLKEIQITEKHKDTATKILRLILEILTESPDNFNKFKLKDLMLKTILEILTKYFRREDDIKADWPIEIFKITIHILELSNDHLVKVECPEDKVRKEAKTSDEIEYFLARSWVPTMINYTRNSWDHEDPIILIEFFEKYKEFIPEHIFDHFMDKIILPVLKIRLEEWSIEFNEIMPNIWIHPWLSFFKKSKFQSCFTQPSNFDLDSKNRLESLNLSLKQKIRRILKEWKPESDTALKLLRPWKTILDKKDWEDIIYRDVLPKLFFFMEKFDPNPTSKYLFPEPSLTTLGLNTTPLEWFVDWAKLLPEEILHDAYDGLVFDKIELVVDEYAKNDDIERNDVEDWLLGWLNFFPEAKVDQSYLMKKISDLLHKYGLKVDSKD